jgi:hypothetical protein
MIESSAYIGLPLKVLSTEQHFISRFADATQGLDAIAHIVNVLAEIEGNINCNRLQLLTL